MRRILFLSLFFLAGCGIDKLNSNMEDSTAMLTKNTAAVEKSSTVIAANTDEVARSTGMIKYFPWISLVILAILFYPSYRILQQHRKLQQDIKQLLKK